MGQQFQKKKNIVGILTGITEEFSQWILVKTLGRIFEAILAGVFKENFEIVSEKNHVGSFEEIPFWNSWRDVLNSEEVSEVKNISSGEFQKKISEGIS